MKTCKECKYWWSSLDCYGNVAMTCDRDLDFGPTAAEVVATAADDTNMHVALVTGPDFGCVNFEVLT